MNDVSNEKKRLARAYFEKKDLGRALDLYCELCALDEQDAQSWHMAGAISGILGKYKDAVNYCGRVIDLQPKSYNAHLNLGNALMALGQLDGAQSCLEKALLLHSGDPGVYNSLGSLRLHQGCPEEARECYKKALQLDPERADSLNNMGVVIRDLGSPGGSIPYFRKSLSLSSSNLDAWINLGNALLDTLNTDEAEGCFRKALAIAPGHADALVGLGTILERRGKPEQAYIQIQSLVDHKSNHAQAAILYSKLGRHLRNNSDAVALLRRLLADRSVAKSQRIQLHFAMGRLLDKMGEYGEAFENFRHANLLSGRKFALEDHIKLIDNVMDVFSSEFMAQAPRSGMDSSSLVFIVAMPRSGTSLVEQILASHPDVFACGEINYVAQIVENLACSSLDGKALDYPASVASAGKPLLDKLASAHLDSLVSQSPSSSRFIDKVPFNFLYLGIIELLFPGARIIHCKRNPLDVCLSCYFQQFAGEHAYSYDLENIGNYYLQYERIMAYWKRTSKLPVLDVGYEDLVSRPEEIVKSIIDFLGLDWNPRCLRFHESQRVVETASYGQVRQPLYNRSIDRWKHYEAHLGPLISTLKSCSDLTI